MAGEPARWPGTPPRRVDARGRPHVYSAGPIPPREGDTAGGHRVVPFLTEAMADDRRTLLDTAVAVLRPRGHQGEWDDALVPPGAQMRLLRINTIYYNRVIGPSLYSDSEEALRMTAPPPGTLAVRYVLRLVDGWHVSPWEDVSRRERFSLGGQGDPGVALWAPPSALDGQHRG